MRKNTMTSKGSASYFPATEYEYEHFPSRGGKYYVVCKQSPSLDQTRSGKKHHILAVEIKSRDSIELDNIILLFSDGMKRTILDRKNIKLEVGVPPENRIIETAIKEALVLFGSKLNDQVGHLDPLDQDESKIIKLAIELCIMRYAKHAYVIACKEIFEKGKYIEINPAVLIKKQ